MPSVPNIGSLILPGIGPLLQSPATQGLGSLVTANWLSDEEKRKKNAPLIALLGALMPQSAIGGAALAPLLKNFGG